MTQALRFRSGCVVLAVAGLAATAHAAPFSFTTIGQTYTQDFNDYRGTEATLPAEMFITWDEAFTTEPFQGVNTGALTAYTSDNVDHSFGIRERNPVDLRDARLYLEFTNDTGVPITGFQVSYYVEAWYVGNRANRIRLKYDDTLGANRFETDIFSTDNPLGHLSSSQAGNTDGMGDYDGKDPANRVLVSGFVDLMTLEVNVGDDPRTEFGALMPGDTAFFRWQFSNTGGDGGSLRSGLAIDSLSFQAVPEPGTLMLLGLGGIGAMLRRRSRR